jgi:type IV secretion system protein VirB8
LKTVEPYIVRVVSETGEIDVMSSISSTEEQWETLTGEEALIEHLVVKYVSARETYSKVDLTRLYNIVRSFSSAEVFRAYEELWRDDKRSPFSAYGDDTVSVRVESVTFLERDTVTVRFRKLREQVVGVQDGAFVAVIRFKFVRTAATLDERWSNPLGFQVIGYRIDMERLERMQ